jgi:hypothetical protein
MLTNDRRIRRKGCLFQGEDTPYAPQVRTPGETRNETDETITAHTHLLEWEREPGQTQ